MQIMQKLSKYNVDYSHGKINDKTHYHLFKRQEKPINISASFAAGARFEKKIGLAHFLEHMLLAGTEKYPNKRLLAIAAENIGGTIGGIVNDDLLTIWFEIAEKKDLDLALELLDQVINHPLFDEQTIETERGAILTEIQTRYHNRAVQVIDLANTLVFQNTPSGKLSLQTEDTIKLVKKSDLTDYYQKILKNSSVSWSIAGDIDEVKITEALDKIHSPLASMEETFNKEQPIIREESTSLGIFEDKKADLYFGFRTESAKAVNAAALEIIYAYLAQGRGSKLQDELRYKRGLIYSCRGENYPSLDLGEWYITTACSADKTQEVLDVIINELKDIKENGLSDEELQTTKNKIIKNNIIKMQTAKSWADWGSKPAFISAPEKFLITNYEEAIEKVTAEEIKKVAQKYLTADNWYLAMCGPKSLEEIEVKM